MNCSSNIGLRVREKSVFWTSFGRGRFQDSLFSFQNISSYRRKILFEAIYLYIRHNGVAFFLTSPSGESVSSLMTQKSPHRFSRSFRPPLLMFNISVNFSTRVNFGCFMKLWPSILKWLHAGITFGLLSSFLSLISLKWNEFLDFPTYWIFNSMHSIK